MSAWKKLARVALHNCGGLAAVRRWNRRGLRILTYHAFPPQVLLSLERQCAHLRRYYRPVSLPAVAESLRSGQPLPGHALAVTIDDGYADFTSAWPIFRRYEIPVLVYLVTDFLDLQLWFWWNRILYAVSQTSCREMEISLLPENTPLRLPLESGPQRRQAAGTLIEAAKALPNSRRLALCEELLERLRVKLPPELPAEWRPLSWDQVRRLRQDGAEFGAHTKTHPILSTVEDAGSLRLEITGSKQRIEAEIDAAVLHFSYPNGRMQDVDRRTVDTVRESGFETAVTTEAGLNFFPEPLLLQRFLVDPAEPSSYFAERVSGLHHIRRAREVPRLD